MVYEAGPSGYGFYRELCRRGGACEIVAPSLIPRRAGDRIKNDRRDCARLAELARSGELKAIWVPDEEHESMHDLCRAREDAVNARLKARQQLNAFLLRHDRRFPGKTSWNKSHATWIAEQCIEHVGERVALAEYQLAVQAAEQRVERLITVLSEAIKAWRFESVVTALRALRGIAVVSAVGLVAETGDINSFDSPRRMMGYLGLMPSEHSSGNSVRRGLITKWRAGLMNDIHELSSALRKQKWMLESKRVVHQGRVDLNPSGEDAPPCELGVPRCVQVVVCRNAGGHANRGDSPRILVVAAACMPALRRDHELMGSIHCVRSERTDQSGEGGCRLITMEHRSWRLANEGPLRFTRWGNSW